MPYITTEVSATLKIEPKANKDLPTNLYFAIPKGVRIGVTLLGQEGIFRLIQIEGNLTIKKDGQVVKKLQSGDRYYIYPPEWQDSKLWGLVKQDIDRKQFQLQVPYFNQVDNRFEPMRTCNTSSCAMVAKFFNAKIVGDDDYYQIVRKYGDTTDHQAQSFALEQLGISSQWRTDLGFVDIDNSLLVEKKPVVIGILHRGSDDAPTGGHMIVVIGKSGKDYIVHDPFGSIMDSRGGYTGDVSNGRGALYPRWLLEKRWTAEGEGSGWGRLFAGNM